MEFEDEEWNDDFILQAEELLNSVSATQLQPQHHQQQQQQNPLPTRPYRGISYSPPRVLSQRTSDTPAALRLGQGDSLGYGHGPPRLPSSSASVSLGPNRTREPKIVGVKDKREEKLKFTASKINEKGTENCKSNVSHYDDVAADDLGLFPEYQKRISSDEQPSISLSKPGSRAIGVQTDDVGELNDSNSRLDHSIDDCNQQNLLDIWDLSDREKSQKSLALKLFEACGNEFQVLSAYICTGLLSTTSVPSSLPRSDGPFRESLQSASSAEHEKVSRLFVMLTKISNEMVRPEDLLDALIDCCSLKNGVIVHVSLRMLHVLLKHASWMRKKLTQSNRDNFVFTGRFSEHDLEDMHNQESFERRNLICPSAKSITDKLDSQGASWLKAKRTSTNFKPPKVDWFLLFELMNQIVMAEFDENVRLEAISIMNAIVISCNAFSDRDKFASKMVFQTVSLLLKKEAGVCLRKQAVNLFYQLLNCPKVTTAFCCGSMDNDGAVTAEVDAKMLSSISEFRVIVDSLMDCLSCSGNCPKKLRLRRSTVTVVAYIASLGKPGIGILLNHKPPPRYSMIVSIVESLISDLDLETLDALQSFEVFRERTLLIREALILLNRLVSHPQFSTSVLQALMTNRDVTTLTVDVAKRLSQKGKLSWQDDSITKQIRESEIPDLARSFKRRVFTFLGDNLS